MQQQELLAVLLDRLAKFWYEILLKYVYVGRSAISAYKNKYKPVHHEFHETCSSVTFIALVNSNQR